MLSQTAVRGTPQAAAQVAIAAGTLLRENAALLHEHVWRQPLDPLVDRAANGPILASRWTDRRTTMRREHSVGASDRYVLAVSLQPVRVSIGRQAAPAFEGLLSAGAIHVTEPGATAEAAFFSPCDFVHFHVAAGYVRDRQAASRLGRRNDPDGETSLHDIVVRDEIAAHLSRTLTQSPGSADPLYAESVGRTILMRVLAHRQTAPRVSALAKWRLRRVDEHLAMHLADPIRLADLAKAAGLSPMHFAAQFRAATGGQPHAFVLQHRIEAAKRMMMCSELPLVEVALSTGFQTQSHFSTIFKRLVGETPARWRRAQQQG